MEPHSIQPGFAFRLRVEESHLFVVITTPDCEGNVLVVNMTTLKVTTEDRSCVLNAGDHPFVTHPTAINYGEYHDPRILPAEEIRRRILKGEFIKQEPLSGDTLSRVLQGAAVSRHMRNKYKELLNV